MSDRIISDFFRGGKIIVSEDRPIYVVVLEVDGPEDGRRDDGGGEQRPGGFEQADGGG